MIPIAGGVAAVVVIGLAALKLMGGKAPTAAADTTHVPSATVPAPDTTSKVEQMSKPTTPVSTVTGATAPDFGRLEALAKDSVTASKALEQVAAVQISNDETKVRVAYVRYLAKLSLGQGDEACTELKAVSGIAQKSSKASVVARNLSDLCS